MPRARKATVQGAGAFVGHTFNLGSQWATAPVEYYHSYRVKRPNQLDLIRLYFKQPNSAVRVGTIDVEQPGQELFKRGHLYQFDWSKKPVRISDTRYTVVTAPVTLPPIVLENTYVPEGL